MRRKIAQLLNSANSFRQAASILVVTSLASNILGLVRNTVIAKNISLAHQDNFWSAFLLPDIVFNVLIFGAISSAFIPLFRGLLVKKKSKEAWRLAGNFLAKVSVLVVILSAVLFIFIPQLTELIFPNLENSDLAEVILLSRILLIQTILIGWSYVVGGILNSKKRFLAFSMSPLLYNISMIVGAFLAPNYQGREVQVLIWSVVVGAGLHLLIQIPSLFAVGFKLKYINFSKNEFTKEIISLMAPRSISLGIVSINAVIFAAIARNILDPGAFSIYRLVESFQTAPIAIFANAIAVAIFPILTGHAAREDWPKFTESLERALRFVLFTLIPSTVVFIILRAQIIRLYIGLGSLITWEETISAIEVFGWFAIGIVPTGLVAILARSFYAMKNTLIPMLVTLFHLLFAVSAAYALAVSTTFGASALAIGSSAAVLVQFTVLYMAYVHYIKKPLNELKIVKTGLLTALASAGMAGTMWWTLRLMHYLYETSATGISTRVVEGLLLQFTIALAVGTLTFYLLSKLWLKEELSWVKKIKK